MKEVDSKSCSSFKELTNIDLKITMEEAAYGKVSLKLLRAKGDQGINTALWLPRSEKEVGLKLDLGRTGEAKERRAGHEEKEN